MTHGIDSMLVERGLHDRRQSPDVPHWMVPRARLADRLDLGVLGQLTLVTGPSGWGKTLGVASWAASAQAPDGLIWLSAAGASADPDLFWELLHNGLVEAGERPLAPVPPLGSHGSRRTHALALFGTWLRHSGPRLLVLDDYPTGDIGALGRDLEVVLDHARRGLSLVVISRGEPALAVQRHHVAGGLTRITVPDLAMDWHEVAGVLARHDVDARELTARTVERHTSGWACGVRLAALALRDAPTIGVAMEEADRATVDYLASEVLAKTPPRVRELLVRTSMVADVGQDLARAVMGAEADVLITPGIAGDAFVELHSDRSFRCHPLLRAAAFAELAREPQEVGREALRRAAQWHVDHDQTSTGLEIALVGKDWTWVARALVESYAVPRILAGSSADVVESALAVTAVAAAEPLLEAALLLNRGGPEATEVMLGLVARPGPPGEKAVPDELSEIFVRLAVARARGDGDAGLPLATRARELIAHLRIETQRELLTMLEAHVGALELCNGELDRAEETLRHGVAEGPAESQTSAAPLDCLGQLALLDGFRGNLRQAERQATAVLKSTYSAPRAGVAHAHLAMAWVHVERAEHVPARQHLDRAAAAGGDGAEPW
jgi:LuxR family transcriptional regulator, maltose regulon positive regulatory protein